MSQIQDRQLPQPPPNLPVHLYQFLRELVNQVRRFIIDMTNLQNTGKQTILQLDVLTNPPTSPTVGMVVYADGTGWNPGSGAGFYGYVTGAWVKL